VAKGLSQERLALEAEIDRSYVGRVERGTENVTVGALEAFSGILEIDVSAFFEKIDANASLPPPLRSGRKPKSQ
jgi:transcriptional regulator with XRE-family HTH domain